MEADLRAGVQQEYWASPFGFVEEMLSEVLEGSDFGVLRASCLLLGFESWGLQVVEFRFRI